MGTAEYALSGNPLTPPWCQCGAYTPTERGPATRDAHRVEVERDARGRARTATEPPAGGIKQRQIEYTRKQD